MKVKLVGSGIYYLVSIQQNLDQPIQMMFGFPPLASVGFDQVPECGSMVMVLQVSEFVDQYIVDAASWSFDHMWIDDDLTGWSAASPLA